CSSDLWNEFQQCKQQTCLACTVRAFDGHPFAPSDLQLVHFDDGILPPPDIQAFRLEEYFFCRFRTLKYRGPVPGPGMPDTERSEEITMVGEYIPGRAVPDNTGGVIHQYHPVHFIPYILYSVLDDDDRTVVPYTFNRVPDMPCRIFIKHACRFIQEQCVRLLEKGGCYCEFLFHAA